MGLECLFSFRGEAPALHDVVFNVNLFFSVKYNYYAIFVLPQVIRFFHELSVQILVYFGTKKMNLMLVINRGLKIS